MKLKAKVVKGVQIGAKFGIATANLELTELPDIEEGVYLVEVQYGHKSYDGLLHFGPRKTFGGDLSAEVHIFDFAKDIYDENLELTLGKKLREVKAFKNADGLFTQIEKNIVVARKYFLRQDIRARWKNLSLHDQAHLAEEAVRHIAATAEFLEAERVFIYAPMLGQEITFVAPLMKAFPAKQYFFPKVESQGLKFYSVEAYEDLVPGRFNILEPVGEAEVLPESIDLMFVPAVAADEKGNRLGQGGGFYDKYFAALNADPKRIVVLPKFAVVETVPTEKHDESVDRVIGCGL